MNVAAKSRHQYRQAQHQYQRAPAVDYGAGVNYSVRKTVSKTSSS
jgi:hypothetical protein